MKKAHQKINAKTSLVRNAIRFGIPFVASAIAFYFSLNLFSNNQKEDFLRDSITVTESTRNLLQPYETTLNSLKSFISADPASSQDSVDLFLDNLQIERNLPAIENVFYWKRVSIEQFSEFHQKLSQQDYLTNKKQIRFDGFTYATPFNASDIYVTKYLYTTKKNNSIDYPMIGSMAPGVLNNQLSSATAFARIISGYELMPEDVNKENNQYLVISNPYFNYQGMYAGSIAISLKLDHLFFANIQNKFSNASIQIINPKNNSVIFSKGKWSDNFEDNDLYQKEISLMDQNLVIKVLNSQTLSHEDKKIASLIALLTLIATYSLIYSGFLRRKEENQNSKEMISHFNNLSNQANTDQLTNLYNRRCFFSDISEKMEDSSSYKNLFLLFVDLDGFKTINDHLGHAAGDEILRQYSVRLKSNPLASNSTIYRMGGDEFVLSFDSRQMDEVITVKTIMRIAHELLKITDVPFTIKGETRMLSQSIGIAQHTSGTPEEFLTNADTAMYEAKRLGKNRVVYYSSELHNKVKNRNEILKHLKMAIEENEFYLVFQPKMSRNTENNSHQSCGAEVLMRWESKILGNISPHIFIPIAEEAGMMPLIDNWLIQEAATRIKEFRDLNIFTLFSINISAKQFSNINLPEYFYQTLNDKGISPTAIIIEITESATIREPELAKSILKKFRKYGFGVSVDDFGTGYSSISYLRQFPVTEIKFDRSFTKNINVDEHDEIIISGLYNIAQQLHLDIVMEGVETEKQIAWIENNIPNAIIQGYFFSKPLKFDEFVSFNQEHSGTNVALNEINVAFTTLTSIQPQIE